MPSQAGFDDFTIEYPFPFRNPADDRFYVYYLGRRLVPPKQTGLLVGDGDFGAWTRVRQTPVIAADTAFESAGSSHPSMAIEGDTIHIIYTGESEGQPVICHATAPTTDPAAVSKDAANPIFEGSGLAWDSCGVREAEIFKGPRYFHILYGGRAQDNEVWQIGHVRTRDFRSFEANPHNPIFTPSPDRGMWDCDGILTPQVFEAGDAYYMLYYMLYAGRKATSGSPAWPEQARRSDSGVVTHSVSRLRRHRNAAGNTRTVQENKNAERMRSAFRAPLAGRGAFYTLLNEPLGLEPRTHGLKGRCSTN